MRTQRIVVSRKKTTMKRRCTVITKLSTTDGARNGEEKNVKNTFDALKTRTTTTQQRYSIKKKVFAA